MADKAVRVISRADRARGGILGLCAGDRNGGPIRMALRLADSIQENRGYNEADIIKRWYNWYKGPPLDTERAYDTGGTFDGVFREYEKTGECKKKADQMNSMGVNASHRAVPLACFAPFSTEDLIKFTGEQSLITHTHPHAVSTAVAFNLICRALINGKTLEESLAEAREHVPEWNVRRVLTMDTREKSQISADGLSPLTLEAALWFMINCKGFHNTLYQSLDFAGNANYCPVLVGAMAGILYGYEDIKQEDIEHKETRAIVERVKASALAFAADWTD